MKVQTENKKVQTETQTENKKIQTEVHTKNMKIQTEAQTESQQEIKIMEREDKNIEDVLSNVLNSFLQHEFIIKSPSIKIARANFNKLFNQYSEYKFKKMFPSVEINKALRIQGFKDTKTKGDYYFKNISIDINKFSQYFL